MTKGKLTISAIQFNPKEGDVEGNLRRIKRLVALPTAFPRMRIDQLEVCSRARAIENQLFIVTANHCGVSGGIELG